MAIIRGIHTIRLYTLISYTNIRYVGHNYQQESYRGNGNSRGYYQSESYSEPAPEWMQFGPSSRTEFMELGGEDEIEKKREGMFCHIYFYIP